MKKNMKKLFTLLAVLIASVTAISAQTFEKGAKLINVSVGFGGGLGIPVTINYEQGIYDINETSSIGVGGLFGFAVKSEDIMTSKIRTSNVLLTANASYHWTAIEKLDLYGRLDLGYNIASAKTSSTDSGMPSFSANASAFAYNFSVGARYYFTPKFASNLNLGYGMSIFNLGVTYQF